MNGGAGVVRIPVRIIPKGVLSFRAKWCADFSNTPLLTCGFVVFRVGVWNSALCEILFPLHRADGFGCEVVADAADAGDLVGGAGGNALERWPCTVESSGSARQQSRPSSLRRRTGHGPTHSLEMSGGLSSIF